MLRWIFIFIVVLACHSVAGAASYPAVKITESYEASGEWIKPVTKIYCDRYCVSPTIMVINYDGKEEWFWTSHKGMIDNLKQRNVAWTITTDDTRQITTMIHETHYEEKRLTKRLYELREETLLEDLEKL